MASSRGPRASRPFFLSANQFRISLADVWKRSQVFRVWNRPGVFTQIERRAVLRRALSAVKGGLAMDSTNGRRTPGSRCIALVGPYLSGKTTLLEAILFRTGAIPRQGRSRREIHRWRRRSGSPRPRHERRAQRGDHHLSRRQLHLPRLSRLHRIRAGLRAPRCWAAMPPSSSARPMTRRRPPSS